MADDYVGRSGSHRVHYRYQRAIEERDRARDRCVAVEGALHVALDCLRRLGANAAVAGIEEQLKGGDDDGPDGSTASTTL